MNRSLAMLVVIMVALTGCSDTSGEPAADSVLTDAEAVLCADTSGTFSSPAYKVIVVAKKLGLPTPALGSARLHYVGTAISSPDFPRLVWHDSEVV